MPHTVIEKGCFPLLASEQVLNRCIQVLHIILLFFFCSNVWLIVPNLDTLCIYSTSCWSTPKSTRYWFVYLSPAFLSFLFLYTERMTRTLPSMSTTMVKISTLASAVDTPAEEALSPRSLSFRDKQIDPLLSITSKTMSPQGASVTVGMLQYLAGNP